MLMDAVGYSSVQRSPVKTVFAESPVWPITMFLSAFFDSKGRWELVLHLLRVSCSAFETPPLIRLVSLGNALPDNIN